MGGNVKPGSGLKDLWKKAKERSEKLLMNRDLSHTQYIANHHE